MDELVKRGCRCWFEQEEEQTCPLAQHSPGPAASTFPSPSDGAVSPQQKCFPAGSRGDFGSLTSSPSAQLFLQAAACSADCISCCVALRRELGHLGGWGWISWLGSRSQTLQKQTRVSPSPMSVLRSSHQ